MCGIVGLFLKDKSLEPELGKMLTSMLITMTDRGPDSAGIAIYGDESKGSSKMTVQESKQTASCFLLQLVLTCFHGNQPTLRRQRRGVLCR